MSVQAAKKFIERAHCDAQLRRRLNESEGPERVMDVLRDNGFDFNLDELTQAYSRILVEAPDALAAEQLKEFELWWTILTQH